MTERVEKKDPIPLAARLFERMGVAVLRVETDWRDRSKNGVQYNWMTHKVELSPLIAAEDPSLFIQGVRGTEQLVKQREKRICALILAAAAFISFARFLDAAPLNTTGLVSSSSALGAIFWALLLGFSFTAAMALEWYVELRFKLASSPMLTNADDWWLFQSSKGRKLP